MKKRMAITLVVMVNLFTFCSKSGIENQGKSSSKETTLQNNGTNGDHSSIPAYYDSTLFKIHFSEFSASAEANLIAHNHNLNFIYQSDPGLPGGLSFISVIDAIPGDGFNPLWREVQIKFNAGFTPRQLFSDNAVLAAASGINPEISLDTTSEIYWCPVVGPKQ